MNNRAEITAELSEKVLKKLRKEFLLVSSGGMGRRETQGRFHRIWHRKRVCERKC